MSSEYDGNSWNCCDCASDDEYDCECGCHRAEDSTDDENTWTFECPQCLSRSDFSIVHLK